MAGMLVPPAKIMVIPGIIWVHGHLHVVLDKSQGKELLEEWGGTHTGHPDGLPYPINVFIAKFFKQDNRILTQMPADR